MLALLCELNLHERNLWAHTCFPNASSRTNYWRSQLQPGLRIAAQLSTATLYRFRYQQQNNANAKFTAEQQ
jgi:hypothetical protein